ncbi:MAG TPA: cupin domain-containing protein [Labilithrix sp.]|nr:cupin domain-containing protein [Labilithrix sp.]
MKTCRTASLVASGAFFALGAASACRESARVDVPPVTVARPTASADPVLSGPAGDASLATAPPAPIDAGAAPVPAHPPPVEVAIADLPVKLPLTTCSDAAVAVVEGTATALGETLKAGDVLYVQEGDAVEVKGKGVVVTAFHRSAGETCSQKKLAQAKQVVRLSTTPELTWAKGTMHARLQLGEKQRSDYYLGRLEGQASVAEHVHKGTWEILAAVEASGTFLLDGRESRLGPRQVVFVPPDTKHEWRPDPGSKLVAIQIYSPRGPEQRFLALAAAEKDAGADASRDKSVIH